MQTIHPHLRAHLLRSKSLTLVDTSPAINILILLHHVILNANWSVFLLLTPGTALLDALDDEIRITVVIEGDAVTLFTGAVDDSVHVGDVLVVRPLLEQVSHVDDIGTLDGGCRVPVLDLIVPDFETGNIALE